MAAGVSVSPPPTKQRHLTALCGKGLPLMDFAGNIKRCDGERIPCPGSHLCIGAGMSSVCCQKAGIPLRPFQKISPSRPYLPVLGPRRFSLWRSPFHAVSRFSPDLFHTAPLLRFYFDSSSKSCRPFAFTGCGGNENNFKTKGDCIQFCSAEGTLPIEAPPCFSYLFTGRPSPGPLLHQQGRLVHGAQALSQKLHLHRPGRAEGGLLPLQGIRLWQRH